MSRPRNTSPVAEPPAPDSARQAADLAAFRRMMLASRGTFSLSFAVCDDRTLRDSLIKRLCAEFPGVLVVRLPPNVGDVHDTVRRQLPASPPAAVFIVDLEASIPFEDDAQPSLRALNSSREAWERLACPVVFWLAEYAVTRLTARAPDFWRYRSHQFEFIPEAVALGTAARESFTGFAMVDALPFEEKAFRVTELERRLREAGAQPPAELLPHVLTWSYELAHLYQHANRFSEAEHCLRQALAWTESTFGNDHLNVAVCLNNLAHLLQDTNRLTEAEPLMRRALAIDEAAYGKDQPKVAIRLNNLAALLQATNRLAEAEPLMRRALAIDEAAYGKDRPKVATRLNNLAALLQATNRMAEAEPLMRRARAIDEAAYGKDHPNVAIGLNNLAQLLQAANLLAEAEPLMCRALAINEAAYGKDHPKVAIHLNNLALLLRATNRMVEAEPLMRRHLEIFVNFTRATGHPHPHLDRATNNYRALLMEMGDAPAQAQEKIDNLLRPLRSR